MMVEFWLPLKHGERLILCDYAHRSDWNGYEVGYPDIAIVGEYSLLHDPVTFFADISTGEVLKVWFDRY